MHILLSFRCSLYLSNMTMLHQSEFVKGKDEKVKLLISQNPLARSASGIVEVTIVPIIAMNTA